MKDLKFDNFTSFFEEVRVVEGIVCIYGLQRSKQGQ